MPSESTSTSLPTLHQFFSPGGILAGSSLEYEQRPGQHEMARAVEQALEDKRHLIVEAGTGTGKTLAYLLPALRMAQQTGQRIILSTGTKNLQEQIYFKDVPFLESLLGPLRVCYMKGRANYLCRQKLYALRDQPLLNGLDEINHFNILNQWEQTTVTGDRAEVAALPESSALWSKLDARSEACLGQTCPNYDRCFITEMRRKALESDLVIVNHHLFFADLAIKQETEGAADAGVLPEAAAVIFDEAHELEEIASGYFGVGLGNPRIEELGRDVELMMRAKQALSSSVQSAIDSVRDRSRLFFASLPVPKGAPTHLGRMPFPDRAEFLESNGDCYLGVSRTLERLQGELEQLRNIEEAPGLAGRCEDIRAHLRFLMESPDRNTVFWIERRAIGGVRNLRPGNAASNTPAHNTFLQATPIDVSDLLTKSLFDNYSSVILTSATLTVQGGFEHLRRRLGLSSTRELVVPSHFDYGKQALLYLPPEMPDPRSPDFPAQAAERIRRVLEITKGRAFCLFTSYSQMRDLYERLLPELPYPLLLHGSAPRKALIEEFRNTPNAVLFGTTSFWQGVDVQGEQLSCVIVDKLPFAVPTDPVVAARMQAITDAGGSAFNDLQLPSSVIALKQGFGRLIRSLKDRGVLVLLDPRIQRQRYGRVFIESLPPYRITQDIAEVERFFEVRVP
jgi:ATP-dependent DNA helicase DinG